MTIDSGLLSSCATPASIEPNAAIFLALMQRLAAALELALRRANLGQVAHERREQALAGHVDLGDGQLRRKPLAAAAHRLDLDPAAEHAAFVRPPPGQRIRSGR